MGLEIGRKGGQMQCGGEHFLQLAIPQSQARGQEASVPRGSRKKNQASDAVDWSELQQERESEEAELQRS